MIMTWNVATQFPWVLFQIISLGWFRYKHICKFVEFFNEKVTIVILFSIVSCLCKTQTIILSMKSFFVLYIDSHIAYSQSSSFTIDCLQLRTWCLLLHTLWRIHLSFSIPLSFTGRPSSTSLPSDKKIMPLVQNLLGCFTLSYTSSLECQTPCASSLRNLNSAHSQRMWSARATKATYCQFLKRF